MVAKTVIDGRPRSGPLRPPPNATTHGMSIETGRSVTWGGAYLLNDTADPVTIEAVDLIGYKSNSGARVDRVEIVDPGATGSGIGVVDGDGYAAIAPALRRSSAGYRMEPRRNANVLVKVTGTKAGVWNFEAVEITYRVAGSEHTLRLPNSFVLCVDVQGECPSL